MLVLNTTKAEISTDDNIIKLYFNTMADDKDAATPKTDKDKTDTEKSEDRGSENSGDTLQTPPKRADGRDDK